MNDHVVKQRPATNTLSIRGRARRIQSAIDHQYPKLKKLHKDLVDAVFDHPDGQTIENAQKVFDEFEGDAVFIHGLSAKLGELLAVVNPANASSPPEGVTLTDNDDGTVKVDTDAL